MKIVLITACIGAMAFNADSQNTHLDYKYSLKLCDLAGFQENSHSKALVRSRDYYFYTDKQLELLHPLIAFQIKTKKSNFQEFTLSDLKWKNTTTGTEFRNDSLHSSIFLGEQNITETAVSFGYEYTLVFFKKKDVRFVPSLGFGANPYFSQLDHSPDTAVPFHSVETNAGLRLTVSPGLSWYFGKRLFADLKLPLCIANTNFREDKLEDPLLPANEQNTSSIDFRIFPKAYAVRLGIGIIL